MGAGSSQGEERGASWDSVAVKDEFASLQALWDEQDFELLVARLKDTTLNFTLDKVKFGRFLQLSSAYDSLVKQWYSAFSADRASQVVDGLEFLSACIMISSKLTLFQKICILFNLFDLDKTGNIRRDEFPIFMKAVSTGLYRMVRGLPPPASMLDLGSASSEYFDAIESEALSQQDLLSWMTEAHASLEYLAVLSRLESAVFAWGWNQRGQLGLHFAPKKQTLPGPLLAFEGVKIVAVATHESHSLFVTQEGRLWTCGSGFCGLLGHGDLKNCPQPRLVENLAHAKIVHVVTGVRHAVAVADNGTVYTWGAADMGQLGHGDPEDTEIHESAVDPRTGSTFTYISKPTVVMELFGKRIKVVAAACCNFSTAVISEQGHLYSFGNNTDGQCGQGQKCVDHRLVYTDPHMLRTAMQVLAVPRRLDEEHTFKAIAGGGYHMLAIDKENRVWSWGQGLWGKLGHGDQRTLYKPGMLADMKYQLCTSLAAGEAHSICLCALFRLTITGSSEAHPLNPFSLLGLPLGRVDKNAVHRKPTRPPSTSLQLNAFSCSRLMQVGLPFIQDSGAPLIDHHAYPLEAIQQSTVLVDRGLWEGQWLKLATTDFDFKVVMSKSGAELSAKIGLTSKLMFAADGKWEPEADCADKICVAELPPFPEGTEMNFENIERMVADMARKCQKGHGRAFIAILPKKQEVFCLELVAPGHLSTFPFGVMGAEHGAALKTHVTRLISMRIADAPDGIPDEAKGWRECRAEYTEKIYFEHPQTGKKRWAPPMIFPNSEATLLSVPEDNFIPRLEQILQMRPKAVVICQQSYRPDVELIQLPDKLMDKLEIPITMVSYEAGEELKNCVASGSKPFATMEIQSFGGVFAWGNGSFGQLGLSGIENRDYLTHTHNMLTHEESAFSTKPAYVSHLHEHQVTSIACGAAHSIAVTGGGEVFSWGAADGLGIHVEHKSEVPVYVEQLEAFVSAKKAFAGHRHTFVLADMPFKPIV